MCAYWFDSWVNKSYCLKVIKACKVKYYSRCRWLVNILVFLLGVEVHWHTRTNHRLPSSLASQLFQANKIAACFFGKTQNFCERCFLFELISGILTWIYKCRHYRPVTLLLIKKQWFVYRHLNLISKILEIFIRTIPTTAHLLYLESKRNWSSYQDLRIRSPNSKNYISKAINESRKS